MLTKSEYMREYRAVNKEPIRKQRQAYRQREKEKISAYQKDWHKLHPSYWNDYRAANIERIQEREKARYQDNKEHYQKLNRIWSQNNKDKCNAHDAARYARELQATPVWLDKQQKQEILSWYTEAQATNLEVDHIVPLKGKTVCGLHVPWNLQLLTRSKNASKSNKHIT